MNSQSNNNISPLDRDLIKASATGHWREILQSLGIEENFLQNRHGPCPACGGKDRYRFDNRNGDGTFFCGNCGSGDAFTLLMKIYGWNFRTTLSKVESALGPNSVTVQSFAAQKNAVHPIAASSNQKAYLERLWKSAHLIERECPADLYLRLHRGFSFEIYPATLRWIASHKHICEKGETFYPIMVAKLQNPEGETVAIHRTYLTSQGKPAPVPPRSGKKLTKRLFEGANRGAAIRLFEAGEVLGLAEGIETALAGHLRWGIPFWSTYSASGMRNVLLPPNVEHVVICVDHDYSDAGLIAAHQLEQRLLDEGRTVQLPMPITPGFDIADLGTV